jgi:hypothetical protein
MRSALDTVFLVVILPLIVAYAISVSGTLVVSARELLMSNSREKTSGEIPDPPRENDLSTSRPART